MIKFTIPGIPQPQGSKRHVGNGIMVESCKGLKPWRAEAIVAIQAAMDGHEPFHGPVDLDVAFYFPRPNAHFNAKGQVKDRYLCTRHATRPDLDKLLRALCDALTQAGAIRDDSRIWHIIAAKRYGSIPATYVELRSSS